MYPVSSLVDIDGARLWRLCHSCASHTYGIRAPSEEYTNQVARLLFGTAMQESGGLKHNRQMGYGWADHRGAFGLWQIELISIRDSLEYLDRHVAVAARASEWLWQNLDSPPDWYDDYRTIGGDDDHGPLLRLMCGWHRLNCLMARVHYLRRPEPVPYGPQAHAAYWKQWYNSELGAGEPADYIGNWVAYAVPVLRHLGVLR